MSSFGIRKWCRIGHRYAVSCLSILSLFLVTNISGSLAQALTEQIVIKSENRLAEHLSGLMSMVDPTMGYYQNVLHQIILSDQPIFAMPLDISEDERMSLCVHMREILCCFALYLKSSEGIINEEIALECRATIKRIMERDMI
eukprot:95466-Hanusia_phi.AAC.3